MSEFFNQVWAIQPDYLLKMEEVLEKRMLFKGADLSSEFNNSEKNTPFTLSIEAKGIARGKAKSKTQKVQVIPIIGSMFKRANWLQAVSGAQGTSKVIEQLAQANQDEQIAGIVLQIDSPGGTVDGTESLANAIKNSKKPVVAFVDGMAASAAYWTASQTKKVIASENTALVGSIGTLFTHVNNAGWHDKKGIKVTHIVSDGSEDKIKAHSAKELDEEDIASIKSLLNPINENFKEAVKSGRGELGEEVFTGKVFDAKKGIELNLVDSIGTLQDAIESVVSLSNQKVNHTMEQKSEAQVLQEVMQAQIDEQKNLVKENKEALRVALEEKTSLKAEKEKLEKANKELEAKNADLLKQLDSTPAASKSQVAVEQDLTSSTRVEDAYASKPWNKQAQKMYGRKKAMKVE